MCHHKTYLFSLCGHTTVTKEPIKHTKPCPHAASSSSANLFVISPGVSSQVFAPDRSTSMTEIPTPPRTAEHKSTRQRSAHGNEKRPPNLGISGVNLNQDQKIRSSLVDPFPSPEELEFVRQLHDDSFPASPTSPGVPIRLRQRSQSEDEDEGDILDAYTGNESTTSSYGTSVMTDDSATSPIKCPTTTTHPLLTFILPALCRTCNTQRERNIAHFEAQAIKDCVDRGARWIPGSNKGVVDAQRCKIWGAKGKLIPLICVEEGRIRREKEMEETEEQSANGSMSSTSRAEDMTIAEEQIATPPKPMVHTPSDMPHGQLNCDQPNFGAETQPLTNKDASRSRTPSTASIPPAQPTTTATTSSSWSWWKRSTPSVPTTSKQLPTPLRELSPTSTKISSTKTVKTWLWRGVNSGVARDPHGRNLKGMNRIMGWDGGGLPSASKAD